MRLTTFGRPLSIDEALVARVVEHPSSSKNNSALLVRGPDRSDADLNGFRAVLSDLSDDALGAAPSTPRVCELRHTDHLSEGDIVSISPRRGEVRTLFRRTSPHNVIFTTDRCNSNCLMCSQPPKDHDDSWRVSQILEMIRLIEQPPMQLGITGGEPTLLGTDLFRILESLHQRLPTTQIHMLTNGRRFANREFTDSFAKSRHPRLTLGVPIYSDHAQEHDFVVQAEGAFDQTVVGLHTLARHRQPVEIRVVIHLQTARRLTAIADFLWRNLPFASHVALMGLEPMGYTKRNREHLLLDPLDYQRELREAVRSLVLRGVNVSIYNHQLCVLDRSLWPFARKSISDWKNIYLSNCDGCIVREDCGGFFASAQRFHSANIRPIETLS